MLLKEKENWWSHVLEKKKKNSLRRKTSQPKCPFFSHQNKQKWKKSNQIRQRSKLDPFGPTSGSLFNSSTVFSDLAKKKLLSQEQRESERERCQVCCDADDQASPRSTADLWPLRLSGEGKSEQHASSSLDEDQLFLSKISLWGQTEIFILREKWWSLIPRDKRKNRR